MKHFTRQWAKFALTACLFICLNAAARAADTRLPLKDYLIAQFDAMNEKIDVRAYQLNMEEHQTYVYNLVGEIKEEHPELAYFMSTSTGLQNDNGTIAAVTLFYLERNQETFEAEVAKAMSKITPDMTQMEQVVAIHDYVCDDVTYNYKYASASITEQQSMGNLRAAILDKKPICVGYAKAFYYYMRLLGIPVTVEENYVLNHAWNTVEIDGEWYLIDLTWDDTAGELAHSNMIRSARAFGHSLTSADPLYTKCTDTRYDNTFWLQANGAMAIADHQFYYAKSGIIYRHSTDATRLSDASEQFKNTNYAKSNVTALDNRLFYTAYDGIYEINPTTKETTLLVTCNQPTYLRAASGELTYKDANGNVLTHPLVASSIGATPTTTPTPTGLYDLNGRRVREPQKGSIYINNGQKIRY